MSTERSDRAVEAVRANLAGTRDALSVRRVFGEAYEMDGMKVIPVARVGGGAGGGGGDSGDDNAEGSGFGSGFGLGAAPVGVYEVHGDTVQWRPAIDVNRIVKGAQILMGIIGVCVTLVLLKRR